MKRRHLLALAIASMFAVAIPATAGDALLFDRDGDTVTVRGSGDDLAAFLNRYQNSLWQGWQDATSPGADDNREAMKRHEAEARATGKLQVYAGCEITRKAFLEAIR